jgi:hypothetical protein
VRLTDLAVTQSLTLAPGALRGSVVALELAPNGALLLQVNSTPSVVFAMRVYPLILTSSMEPFAPGQTYTDTT